MSALADRIVEAIIRDMTDRRGLRHEWDCIDWDIQKEILDTWRALVQAEIEKAPEE